MNVEAPVVAGHAVKSPLLVSIGGGCRWMAYACAVDVLAVCALRAQGDGEISPDDEDFVESLRVVPLPDAQRVCVVHIHQVKDLLCVGTAGDGLYVTAASNPVFRSDSTRLPLRATGESIFAACFVNGPASDGSDALVISSSFREFGRKGARLSVWDVSGGSLLWRGCADAAESIVPLPAALSFATATRRGVALWFGAREGHGASRALTVRSRACTAVEELRGAEFVALAPPAEAEGEAALTALTGGGFLVAFDCRTGTARRWMDCKVCPAASLARAAGGLLVCGALVRLFAADSWEFRGKVLPGEAGEKGERGTTGSSVLARLAESVCGGAAAGAHCAALFCAGGGLARFHIRPAAPARCAFACAYRYAAPAPGEEPLRFFLAQRDTRAGDAGGVCLWSPHRVRRFDAALRPVACVEMDSTCAAHHTGLHVLLLYDSAHYEVVALPLSLRAELCRVPVSEPLVSLAARGRGAFVGLSPDGCLFRFAGEWTSEGFALSARAPQRLAAHVSAAPLLHLAAVGDTLFAASARTVARIDGSHEVPIAMESKSGANGSANGDAAHDILALASTESALMIVRQSGCTLLDVASHAMTHISVPPPLLALHEAVPAAAAPFVALCGETEVAIVRMDDRACVWRRPVSGCRAAQLTPNGRTLILCDSGGAVAAWPVSSSSTPQNPKWGRRSSLQRRQQQQEQQLRSRSCGGPTNDELQMRYRDLHGFYETTRRQRSPRAPSSSSGVLILARGDSILQLPATQCAQTPLRRWESEGVLTELPQALASPERDAAAPCAVSTSTVNVSALTSMESRAPRGFRAESELRSAADMTSSLAAEIMTQRRTKVTFTETPAFGVRSPARKGAAAPSSLERTPEDDVVNMDSLEDMERRGTGAQALPSRHADPSAATPRSSLATSSTRERSFEIRNGLRELAELCESQIKEGEDSTPGVNAIDEEAVEDLFASVSRLYAVLQLRQSRRQEQQRPESVRSNVSDTSVLSANVVLAELQRMQLQNSRIESQNLEILSKLQGK